MDEVSKWELKVNGLLGEIHVLEDKIEFYEWEMRNKQQQLYEAESKLEELRKD